MEPNASPARRAGPLADLRVVEFAGIGPGPFACMLLSDMGADVVTIDRPGARASDPRNVTQRGRTVVQADLKDAACIEQVLQLLQAADVLVEGFRPGVMERLGLGPEAVARRNARLVYGRMTGWGQHGPLAQAAGHDINYIALTGALHAIGTADRPVPPLNLLGDYGGGSLYLVMGILAALHEARRSGLGQVVDAAITDGVVNLMAQFIGQSQRGAFVERRESNMLDGGWPWYGVYETADGPHVSVGPLEPQFFARLCELLQLGPEWQSAPSDRSRWPALREALAQLFKSRPRGPLARAAGRNRRLLRARAAAQRSRPAPAQRRAWRIRGAGWRHASRTGAALLADAGSHPVSAGRCRRGPGGRAWPLARLAQPPLHRGCWPPGPAAGRPARGTCPAAGSGW
jgi:alpha-methylacyl-CoA racemase